MAEDRCEHIPEYHRLEQIADRMHDFIMGETLTHLFSGQALPDGGSEAWLGIFFGLRFAIAKPDLARAILDQGDAIVREKNPNEAEAFLDQQRAQMPQAIEFVATGRVPLGENVN